MNTSYLITGAAKGIGRATAIALASAGHTVIAASRGGIDVPGCVSLTLDVTSDVSIQNARAFIQSRNEKIAGLINNAGALINQPFNTLVREDFQYMAEVNWIGPAMLIQSLAPCFTSDAHIVNISSMGGYQGAAKYPGLSAYASSKAALVGLTECLQVEWGEKGWAFNVLCLGAVQTEMLSEAFPGYVAPTTPETMGAYIASFVEMGHKTHAGAVLAVAKSNP
ncbi:MAG: hypothetical protein ABR98_04695 [Cryomorphaceae bacterium BACL7 MAG-120910-bin2]|jgi:3-oxoacyl-[acyl-carrier protein] reductase|nr:MAG: hypothetical protein ABR98_04695 [Cryomorphaceae bacterium BACL7 MAG-120910-bin2]KRO69606.1 MAG: hypothetical protein ABR88_06400 [Cryomorphaceae bacterium BACL7 MAG-120322-bin74]KRO82325.1 MAG: hypothetical protein ABR87_03290 [Cryomorphaceae bacterium BACL7 MAG-121220-bin83]NQW24807.1 SDR family oxidoreductase [Cryomorphaceae bacterium]